MVLVLPDRSFSLKTPQGSIFVFVCLQDKAVQALRMTGNKSVEQAIEFLNQMKMIEGKNGINKAGKLRHLQALEYAPHEPALPCSVSTFCSE